jgi:FKBP-type peptidyl-prolyl cis-trans isomerase
MNAKPLAAVALTAAAAFAATTQPAERMTPSGLKIVDTLRAGEEFVAQPGDVVYVQYTGKLTDGQVFDSSNNRPDRMSGLGTPIAFTLGRGNVIKGWDEGIAGMRVGDQRTLTIPPELGYGDRGAGGLIKPGATLIFDVKLVGLERK